MTSDNPNVALDAFILLSDARSAAVAILLDARPDPFEVRMERTLRCSCEDDPHDAVN
jgi:hypothetical protein